MITVNEIIWVDDEPIWCERHISELVNQKYKVHSFDNVDDADENFDKLRDVNGVVLDINMPWGYLFTEEITANGLTTGILLLARWKERLIARKQPVAILTNREVEAVRVGVAALGMPNGFVKVFHKKLDTSPQLFPNQLSQLLVANGVYRR